MREPTKEELKALTDEDLPSLISHDMQEREGGWTRWIDREAPFSEMEEIFDHDETSLVWQLCQHVRRLIWERKQLRAEVERLNVLVQAGSGI